MDILYSHQPLKSIFLVSSVKIEHDNGSQPYLAGSFTQLKYVVGCHGGDLFGFTISRIAKLCG